MLALFDADAATLAIVGQLATADRAYREICGIGMADEESADAC